MKPHNLGIGLANSEFQKFEDQEEAERLTKNAKQVKFEMEMALRAAKEIQERKKRQVAVYEKLEKELTRFELEEEEDEEELNKINM